MKQTKNYGLHKADPDEYYDINIMNENLDKIDEKMGEQSEAINKKGDCIKYDPITKKMKLMRGNILLSEAKISDATKKNAGIVKPADGLTVEEDGTIKVNIDGTTLTMDQVNNVIKLADTLKDAINGAFPAANVANNQITTVEGFALDARQANPNLDGTLAKQISDLNGSLNNVATKNDINALNPSEAIRLYVDKAIGQEGAGWYRFAKIICVVDTIAKGSTYTLIETLIRQSFSNGLGCFHKIDFYLIYSDSAKISVTGHNSGVLKKVRIVRNDNTIFLDVYSNAVINSTEILSFIPFKEGIQSAECIKVCLVPETSDGEVIVCSVDLANNI